MRRLVGVVVAAGLGGLLVSGAPTHGGRAVLAAAESSVPPPSSSVVAAALQATEGGNRTAVAVLDVARGTYLAAGEDTAPFPAESVVKVLIAVQLLADGRMDAGTSTTALRMITASDDAAADALYDRAGGDRLVDLVAARYSIAELGSPPPVPGRWGLTRLTADGLVHLYAAVTRDAAVWPWLARAMAHPAATAADGTDQRFGLLAAWPDAMVKQGWGHDAVAPEGSGTGNAVVLSTGLLDGGRLAVAVLTSGPPASYLTPLAATVTAQARRLPPGGSPLAPAPERAASARTAASAVPASALPTAAGVVGVLVAACGARGLGRRIGMRRRARHLDRLARHRQRQRRTAAARWSAGQPVLVRLPNGQRIALRRAVHPRLPGALASSTREHAVPSTC